MNVAYLCADFGVPFFGAKGASVHAREMVAALSEAGHSVRVFAPVLEESAGSEAGDRGGRAWLDARAAAPADGRGAGTVRLIEVPAGARHVEALEELKRVEALAGIKTRMRQELRNLLYNLPLRDRALEELTRERVDFVYERYALFGFAGLELARALDIPHLLEVNAPLAEEQERMRGLEMKELARGAERRILRATDAAVVVSTRLGEFVASCGVPESRIHVLPNAVDPRRFAPRLAEDGLDPALRARLAGRCVIGFVGSLKPWHGTETLLEAFHALGAEATAAHLLVVGDGPGRAELESWVRARGLEASVTFTGAVPHDQVPRYLGAMDVATAPYTPSTDFYFSPIKIFEYMAMGKPVVAGRIGQIEELVADGETAILYPPGDVAALAAALARLARDQELRRRVGERARAWVLKERTWSANAGRVVAIARELAAARATGPRGGAPEGAGGERAAIGEAGA